MDLTGMPRGLSFNFNPSGILPGRGARSLDLVIGGSDGAPRIEFARLGPSSVSGLPVRSHRYRPGSGTDQVRAAVAALEAALPRLTAAFEAGPSDAYHVDNGWGWARNGTFVIHNGPVGFTGTESYVGQLSGDARPAVREAVQLLGSLATALRAG